MSAPARARKLASLVDGLAPDLAPTVGETLVTDLCLDSCRVKAGDLFVALRGADHDGHAFLGDAARAGAVAALVETAAADAPLPAVVVPDLRRRLGTIAARFFDHPGRSLHVSAVTGTNGKTTVSQLLAQLIRGSGYACGTIGTLGASADGLVQDSVHTTPDPISLQRILAAWVDEALPFVALEASSHALDQGRLSGVDVDTAIFTNLTRDHLDYHGDMQAYGNSKALLVEMPSLRAVVLNADDPFSAVLRQRANAGAEIVSYGVQDTHADVRISRLEVLESGLRFRFASPWGEGSLRCPLIGAFNVSNVAAALTAALEAGLPYASVVDALARLQPVPGRMQPVRVPDRPLVVIDYAHTPDALSQVLQTLRELCTGRLIVVFGCGGDRDRGKRPLMAEAVSAAADLAIITSDNPRSEDPLAIIADVEAGMRGAFESRVDRADAIRRAIDVAVPGDCVLIAGKGHEAYQVIGSERRPFDDAAVARAELEGVAA